VAALSDEVARLDQFLTADAVDDQASAGEGAITISVLANDSGHGLVVTDVGSASNGITFLAPGGLKVNYTPDPFFSGVDTFGNSERAAGSSAEIT